jgi:hypothetical protein
MTKMRKDDAAPTAAGMAMGDALKKAGFDPEKKGEDGPEVVDLTAYEVEFTYEAGAGGKRYTQTSVISDCRNAQDAQKTVLEEIQKRGLDPDKVEFVTTVEKPELQKQTVIEAPFPEDQGGLFPEDPAPAAQMVQRRVSFNAKVAKTQVSNGDSARILTIQMVVGSDVPRVEHELLSKFSSAEYLVVTVEPLQLRTTDVVPEQTPTPKEPADAELAPENDMPEKRGTEA